MMDVKAVTGHELSGSLIEEYFHTLVNRFFKILPMRENGEESLQTYMRSLSIELIGFGGLIPDYKANPLLITLLSILEYLIDTPDCGLDIVRREVFHAISVCNKLNAHFSSIEEV